MPAGMDFYPHVRRIPGWAFPGHVDSRVDPAEAKKALEALDNMWKQEFPGENHPVGNLFLLAFVVVPDDDESEKLRKVVDLARELFIDNLLKQQPDYESASWTEMANENRRVTQGFSGNTLPHTKPVILTSELLNNTVSGHMAFEALHSSTATFAGFTT